MRKKSLVLFSFLSICSLPASLVGIKSEGIEEKDKNTTINVDRKLANSETLRTDSEVLDFNKGWVFKQGSLAGQNPEAETFNDTAWRRLTLPHDFMIENDFTGNANGEVGHLAGGEAWYRKSFIVPSIMLGKRISITFNGVMSNATIYVNGKKVGSYPSGYLPLTFDLTSFLKFGDDQINTIAVNCKVITTPGSEQSRWYTGGGIYRDVNLNINNPTHIKNNSTKIETLNLKKTYEAVKNLPQTSRNYSSDVHVTSTLVSSVDASDVTVRTTLLDYYTRQPVDGVAVQEIKTNVTANNEVEVKTVLNVKNPVLWQPWDRLGKNEKPQLYFIKSEVLQGNEVLQTKYDRFGFRYTDWYTMNEAKASSAIKAAGFYLNGEKYQFKGVALHHDQGALGAVANDYAIERQVQYMKKMGANAIRGTHNHQDPAMLRSVDENGLLYIEEFFDTWDAAKKANDGHVFFRQPSTMPDATPGMTNYEYEIKTIVERDRNFPSVVMYSIGNEIWDLYRAGINEQGFQTLKSLKEVTQKYDVTSTDTDRTEGLRRFITMGQDDKTSAIRAAQDLDSIGDNYNKFNTGETYPYRYYGSETSSALGTRGVYVYGNGTTLNPGNETNPIYLKDKQGADSLEYQLSSMDNNAVSWGLTASQALRIEQNNPNNAGQFIWTGFDYIGEPTPWNQESSSGLTPKNSYFGIVDTAGFAKDNYYLYQSQWLDFNKYPMAHIVGHYNWEEEYLLNQYKRPDGKIPVRVYTNAPSVELYIQKPGEAAKRVEQRKTFKDYSVTNDETTFTYHRNTTAGADDPLTQSRGELFQEFAIDSYEYVPGTTLSVKIFDKAGKEVTPIDDQSLIQDDLFTINPSNVKVTTAGKPYAVKLKPEREIIQADGQALAYITAEIVDDQGNIVPNAHNLIEFKYLGDSQYGQIVGVDNGDSSSWERFKDYDGYWRRNAFYGKALVIAQASEVEGVFSIAATSPGLKGDAATIMTSSEYQTIDMDKVVYESSVSSNLKMNNAIRSQLYFDAEKGRRNNG